MSTVFPYFSLIIPMYNRSTMISRTIESCLSQTFTNFELLITDDASSDDSVAVASYYTDSRIRIFRHKQNLGPCPARNTAIDHARGKWCVMVDSDFALLPDALENLFVRTQRAALQIGNLASSCQWDTGKITPFPRVSDIPLDFRGYLQWAESVMVSEKLECIRRQVFETIRYPQGRAWEFEFHLNLAYRWLVQISPEVLVNVYTDAPNRITAAGGTSAMQRILDDAPNKFASMEKILRNYGHAMREYAPKLYNYTLVLVGHLAFLNGQRIKGLRYISTAIIGRSWFDNFWWIVNLWVVLFLGIIFGPKATAWVTVLRRQMVGAARKINGKDIVTVRASNIDDKVVKDFGREWSRFDQAGISYDELKKIFDSYFAIFPWETLPKNARGFDLGCGSGRLAKYVAPQVAELHCIDPSEKALRVAMKNLSGLANCRFHLSGVDNMPLPDNSMDFGYSIGVLHHIPDTTEGLKCCVAKLKPKAPFLLYLYYAFDSRPLWFKMIWRVSDFMRGILSRSPYYLKFAMSQVIATLIYLPLARIALVIERLGVNVTNWPLSEYKNKSFYTMRTDALDRFGTRLEKRFTRKQIESMMIAAGLSNIQFSQHAPFWCAVGYKNV
jgi:glycosyltransferase involved in cell wall biosynthesis/ubiquinone/menaquinone biosynthesis C-methylase UbiE